jgi:uncharacterized protein YutE (UPF0331/DUF86 family)
LDELSERLARLQALSEKARSAFDQDPYLRDVVERNLEIAAQCCIDISNRIVSLLGARKPIDYYGALLSMGELGVVPPDFARRIAPLAGLRNVLVHDYLATDWDQVYANLRRVEDLEEFAGYVRRWLAERAPGPSQAPAA